MKKYIALLGLLTLPVICFAQGTVQFANTSTTQLTTNNLSGSSGLTTGVNTYKIGLYIAPQGTINEASFTLVGLATNQTGLGNGRFNGGNPFTIAGNNGVTIAFQIRAWSFSSGNTYEEAVSSLIGYAGKSTIGEVTPATGVALTPALFGTGPGQVGGFVLTPVIPEPSSIALGLLGLGAIALFRRRK
jgi:hypothetical protein